MNYLALKHPTAQLWLHHVGGEEFTAGFKEYPDANDPIKFLDILSQTLSFKPRFAGQNNEPKFTVLTHQLYVGAYLRNIGASREDELLGLLHDAGEAFFVDVPSPFKVEIDRNRELAIIKAMPYPFLHKFAADKSKTLGQIVHKIDFASCVAEALEFGFNWEWPKRYLAECPRDMATHITTMRQMIVDMDLGVEKLLGYEYAAKPWLDRTAKLLQELGYDKPIANLSAAHTST